MIGNELPVSRSVTAQAAAGQMVYALGTRWKETSIKAPCPRPQALLVNLNRLLQICHLQERHSISRRWQMNQTRLSLPRVCSAILRFSNIIFIKFLGGI